MHVFKLYDEYNTLLHEYKNLKTNAGDNLKDDLNQIELFYVILNDLGDLENTILSNKKIYQLI